MLRPCHLQRSLPLLPLLLLLTAAEAFATALGDPSPTLRPGHFEAGLEAERVVRTVNSSRLSPSAEYTHYRLLARETLCIVQGHGLRLDASALVGLSRVSLDFGSVNLGALFWDTYAPDVTHVPGSAPLQFDSVAGSSLGGALTGRLIEWHDWQTYVGAQVLYTDAAMGDQPAMSFSYTEWDAVAGAAWQADPHMRVYAGLDMSYLTGELRLPDRASDITQESTLGAYGGLRLRFYRHIDVNAELRLLNQTALAVQMGYRF